MKPKIYVTRIIPPPGIYLLEGSCQVTVHESDEPPARKDILENIGDKDGILCLLTDTIDKDVMEAAPNLKVISTMSVGFEHIDIQEATRRGIYIGCTPGVLTEATADLAFALLLAAARKIVSADSFVRNKNWKISWSPNIFHGESLWGGTIGIIGLGRVGKAVAKRARGFNMKILYTDIKPIPPDKEKEMVVEYRSLEELLKMSDFVTIHTPLTKETRHMIDEKKLKLMKSTAILINTSRGAVIDEKALISALGGGWIGAAGLDVFEEEPVDADSPFLLLENVVLLPHIGSSTKQTRAKMSELAALNLLAALKGEAPLHWLNPHVEKIRPFSKIKML